MANDIKGYLLEYFDTNGESANLTEIDGFVCGQRFHTSESYPRLFRNSWDINDPRFFLSKEAAQKAVRERANRLLDKAKKDVTRLAGIVLNPTPTRPYLPKGVKRLEES